MDASFQVRVRYTRDAVPLYSAVFSLADAPAVMRLNAFHSSVYPQDCLSGGKLLSNMQRFAPNASMHGSTYCRHAAARSSDDGGTSRSWKSKPNEVMPRPPSLTLTFGHSANVRMSFFQVSRISCRRPEYGPTPSTPPT